MNVRRNNFYLLNTALVLIAFVVVCVSGVMGQSNVDGAAIANPDKIIQTFTTKETEFRRALNNYSFKRDALIQSLGMGGQVVGEYHRVSNFTFDDSGNRFEKITFFPMPSMPEVTSEDIDDLGGISPFALEPQKLDRYNIRYVGKERIDELNLYIFDVEPKVMPDPKKTKERLFLGRVWVDDQDFQIVKTKGKGVPETKNNKYPVVETYREQIDGRYWFPTYSYADEELVFDNGTTLHVRLKVRYTDFTPARATLKVTEIGENDAPTGSKPVEFGALNAKATSLPKPAYTEEMKRVKARGRVTVRVVVDENGKVTSAQAVDGPLPLRAAAEEAARQAAFSPFTEGGIVVKGTGVLTYDFP
ncbi:MAG TPA: TonB family protein [Pyrinomonadaceae bacterium]|nr:TonB family protein [Pyrinomonadaceae bacterium]